MSTTAYKGRICPSSAYSSIVCFSWVHACNSQTLVYQWVQTPWLLWRRTSYSKLQHNASKRCRFQLRQEGIGRRRRPYNQPAYQSLQTTKEIEECRLMPRRSSRYLVVQCQQLHSCPSSHHLVSHSSKSSQTSASLPRWWSWVPSSSPFSYWLYWSPRLLILSLLHSQSWIRSPSLRFACPFHLSIATLSSWLYHLPIIVWTLMLILYRRKTAQWPMVTDRTIGLLRALDSCVNFRSSLLSRFGEYHCSSTLANTPLLRILPL